MNKTLKYFLIGVAALIAGWLLSQAFQGGLAYNALHDPGDCPVLRKCDVTQPDCLSTDGTIDIFTVHGDTYEWDSGAVTEDNMAANPGLNFVTVTNATTGCELVVCVALDTCSTDPPPVMTYNCTNDECVTVMDSTGTYATMELCADDCMGVVTSYNCTNDECVVVMDSTGTYATMELCMDDCSAAVTSYNCTNDACVVVNDDTGAYATMQLCMDDCGDDPPPVTSYNCTNDECVVVNDATGTYATLTLCNASCSAPVTTYNCSNGNCVSVSGSGGTYSSLSACNASCSAPVTTWNCGATGCVSVSGSGGAHSTQAACEAACVSYNCVDGSCVEVAGTGGEHATMAACEAACSSCACNETPTLISDGNPSAAGSCGAEGPRWFFRKPVINLGCHGETWVRAELSGASGAAAATASLFVNPARQLNGADCTDQTPSDLAQVKFHGTDWDNDTMGGTTMTVTVKLFYGPTSNSQSNQFYSQTYTWTWPDCPTN